MPDGPGIVRLGESPHDGDLGQSCPGVNDDCIDEIEVSTKGDMGAVDLRGHRATLFFSQLTLGLGKRMR